MFAAALVIPAALRPREFSLYDEPSHADYAFRVSHLQLPAPGYSLAPAVLREWSCRGSPLVRVPPCSARAAPASDYPLGGENYNHGHPPLYYLTAGFGARAADAVLPGGNFFAVARLFGLPWLLAGMAVLYLALRRFGLAPVYAVAAVVAVPLVPGVLHASSTATNDATAVLGGAAALFVLARILCDGRRDWAVPVAVTAVVTAMKVLNGLPMLVIAGVLGAMALQRRQSRPAEARELLVIAAGVVVAFVVVFKGWTTFQGLRGVDDWVSPIAGFQDRVISGSPVDELLRPSFTGFQLIVNYYLPSELGGESMRLWARAIGLLASAGPLIALAVFRPGSPRWLVALVTLLGLIAFPLAAELQVYIQNDQFLPSVVGRYGLSFVPWALACLVLVAGERALLRTTLVTTLTGAVVMLLSAYGIFMLGP